MTPDNDNGPLGRVYTLQEAAEYLRMKPRSVAKVAKRHGLCTINGRDLLFSDSDVLQVWDAMRCKADTSSSFSVRAPKTSTTAVLSEERLFSKLREQTTRKPQKRSA